MYTMDLNIIIEKLNEHNRFLLYAKNFDLCFTGTSEADAINNFLAGIELYTKETKDKNYSINKLLLPNTDTFRFDSLKKICTSEPSLVILNRVFSDILTINKMTIYRKERNEKSI